MNSTWETKTLAEVCRIRPPKAEARLHAAITDLVSFVPMEDLGINMKFMVPTKVRPLKAVVGSYTYFEDGDVLMAKITPCFENGKLGIARNLMNGVGFGSSEFIVFRPNKSVDKEWLYYFLSCDTFRTEGARRMSGAVGHKRVSKEFIETHPMPIPPLSEQRRIVRILDEMFGSIATANANAEKNLQNARALFGSHLRSLFSSPDDCPTARIGDIGQVFDGPHATPKTVDAGPVFLGISSLEDGRINLGETRHVTLKDFQLWTRRVKPEPGDVVFSYETRLGQAAIIPEGLVCCLGRRMGLVRLDRKRMDPRFFTYQYISPSFREFLSTRTVRGATVDRIWLKEFPEFPIRLPNIGTQTALADDLDALQSDIQRLKSIYGRKLIALEELKKSILHRAFAGEL